jgi:hypothetical protein
MTHIRLTQSDRAEIKRKALDFAFAKREDDFKIEEDQLGRGCYAHIIPATVRELVDALPEGWTCKRNYLELAFRGMQDTIHLRSSLPVPNSWITYNGKRSLPINDDKLCERWSDFKHRKDAFDDLRKRASAQLEAMLDRFGTLSALYAAWPEGAAFYAHLAPREKSAPVPAVQVQVINEVFGLTDRAIPERKP